MAIPALSAMTMAPPIEHHLHALNTAVAIVALVAIIPIPRGSRLGGRPLVALVVALVAIAVGACMMVVANVVITANDSGYDSPGDWRSDPHSSQWTEQYIAFAIAAVALCLAARLPFTRGVGRRWPVATLVGAIACGVVGWTILGSS
jgi:hypothetical protein